MLLLTLEGLPHTGKTAVMQKLARQRPDWVAINVSPDPAAACSWASPLCRSSHALFASLLRKLRGVSKCAGSDGVVLLNTSWFEHLPRHPALWTLMCDVTKELARSFGCSVDLHVMVLLRVPHDETFEQMVCCGNPFWNGTSLEDVRLAQAQIAQQMVPAAEAGHPFPCLSYAIHCPPFFEENEVVAQSITQSIVDVTSLNRRAADPVSPDDARLPTRGH